MNCQYYSQDEYPDVSQCRENRHDNLLSRGKYCRACAKCPRDLGKKPKDMGGGTERGLKSREQEIISIVDRKPAPPTKIAPRNDFRPKRYATHPRSDKTNLPGKDDEKPAKERACRNCNFPLTGNGAYCGICAPIRAQLKEDPIRLAEELAKVVYRRENGLTRKGHGFQRMPKKRGRPKGHTRHNEKRRGWPKGIPRHSIDWSVDMDAIADECGL